VLSALAKEENLSITQVFPVRGHSYCQCDRNFALYSRVAKKTETIETVDEYVSIIQSSKKTSNPFIVQECVVRDFEKHVKIRKPKKILISKSTVLQYDKSGNLTYHDNYTMMTPSIVRIAHLSKTKLHAIHPAPCFSIASAKRADVMSLLRFVSEKNRAFYENYFRSVTVKDSKGKDGSHNDSETATEDTE